MAIIDYFDRGCRIAPDSDYLIFGERRITYREAQRFSYRVANGLLALGCRKGTHAAVWASNDAVGWLCTLSIWRAGLTWVPINPRNSAEENGYILDAFDCEVLFFQQRFSEVVASLRPKLPKVRQYICMDGEGEGALSLDRWMAGKPDLPPVVEYALEDVCCLQPTGGTTGKPKGVMNTHRAIQTLVASWLAAMPYPAGQRPVNLAAAPLTHASGIMTLVTAVRAGAVVILPRLEPEPLLDAIEKYRITELYLPPTVIYVLLDLPGVNQRDYSSLRYFIYAAAPMSTEKLRRAIKTFGPVMMQGYGQTEAPGTISYLAPEEHFVNGEIAPDSRLSSCGRPYPLVRCAILDSENRPLPDGDVGEICVAGDILMKGYYKDPQKTAETIIDGWLHTGDVGFFDREGYLHITDRKKDMIITGGYNVFSAEVEGVVNSHPAVRDCAVIGVPDDKWGEAVKAVVELNAGSAVTAEEIIALCKQRLGSVKAPKSVDFVDKLPRNSAGKLSKRELRVKYLEG
ncbi:MAG: AMP-binding protein [Acidobacteriia bacterium]|nr:AMP-binding protein [Terriglobia bacterium]